MLQNLRESYCSHAARGAEKVRRGLFHEALGEYIEAHDIARMIGDAELVFEALSNLSMVRLEIGEVRSAQKGLREIILRSRNERVVLGASYNLAVSLRKQGNFARAFSYARRAMEIAKRRREISSLAMCHNLLGNISLSQSLLDQALREYRRALALRRREKGDNRFSLAILKENIGYCLLLRRQLRRGVRWIEEALRLAEETGDRRCRTDCLQDLSYARMRLREYADAARLGEKALEMALAEGYADIEKNCYYLLGEIAHLVGDSERRDQFFNRLQKQYPEMPFLRDFLCAVDVSGIITLKA